MRLNESAQHSWDTRVVVDPAAALNAAAADSTAAHSSRELSFLLGLIGTADAVDTPAGTEVTGAVTLDELRRALPGFSSRPTEPPCIAIDVERGRGRGAGVDDEHPVDDHSGRGGCDVFGAGGCDRQECDVGVAV